MSTPTKPKRSYNTTRRPKIKVGTGRSKAGCSNCKKRKVKCDEKHPMCERCLRRGDHCFYPFQITYQNPATQKPDTEEEPKMKKKFVFLKQSVAKAETSKVEDYYKTHILMRELIESKKKLDYKKIKDFADVVKVIK